MILKSPKKKQIQRIHRTRSDAGKRTEQNIFDPSVMAGAQLATVAASRRLGMTPRRTLSSDSSGPLVKRIITTFLFSLMLVSALGAKTGRKSDWPVFSLGQQKIGEKLRYFKSIFPGSACGSPTDPLINPAINRHTLLDPDDSGFLTCCIDDPESMKRFSELRILTVSGQCPVLVGFWKERLIDVVFSVDVSTIEQMLPEFERLYWPTHRKLWGPDNRLAQVSWWYGDEMLELAKGKIERDSSIYDSEGEEKQFVTISLHTLGEGR